MNKCLITRWKIKSVMKAALITMKRILITPRADSSRFSHFHHRNSRDENGEIVMKLPVVRWKWWIISPDWPRSCEASAVIGGSLCFIEASNKINYFHRPIKNTQKYNNICLIVFILSVMVSSSSSPQARAGPQNCSSINKSIIYGFRRQNILFCISKSRFCCWYNVFCIEVAYFVVKLHYVVVRIIFSRIK